jgi:4-hydroxy-2-oxoheptanedioate aldolase
MAAGGPRNDALDAIRAGEPSFGAWQCIPSGLSAEILARAGFDWILIDLQHGGAGWNDLLSLVQAIELGGALPFVRIGWNDSAQIMRALDSGAAGIVVPMVSTAEDARQAAAATRYPPDGIRSFGPTRNFYDTTRIDQRALCFVMIETEEGLANVDMIAATPGIDGLFVGTIDLALSLGRGLDAGLDSVMLRAIDQVIESCARHGKVPGCVAIAPEAAETLADRGMRFLAIGADIGFLDQGAKREAERAARLKSGIRTPLPR